ncbi:processed acidic surface protein [Neobacillus niacini]|uniref:processed acidic surface protein n=1 Tax=Neobacillus niacini TaxID=86668 RepID=UPI002865C572|nr:processed acidic surface protein [Neobacillus niacini]MDR7078842.1 processed acidic surface protein [Neobacillus niacini]
MKKLGAILLSFSLLIGLFPQLTIAAQNTTFEQDLIQYLKEVSEVRGFEVTKEDIEASLAAYEDSIENYESVENIGSFLGEVINSDLSNLDSIYEEFELDKDGLHQLLNENGEELNDYIFLDNLYSAVYFYTEDGVFERDPNFDQDLVEYLAMVSEERGFEVTKEDIETSLANYETTLEEFETVEDLSAFLSEVIKADLSNLDYFYENYELDQQALFQLLEENGKDINDYVYIDDLDSAVWQYSGDELNPGMDEEIAEDLLPIFQEGIDLTDEELQRIEEHLMSLEEQLSDPAILERLEELGNRMMAFEDFDEAAELTAEQMAEIVSIYDEFLSIFKLKAVFTLVKGGSEIPLSFWDLLKMEELKGANLKVALFSTDGQLLADLIITGEMVDSETVIKTGEQIEESAEEVTKTVEQPAAAKPQKMITQKKPEHKTVKGAKLPNTGSDYIPNALIGLAIVFAGIFMYRRVRNV